MRGDLKSNDKSNITISTDSKIFEEIKKDAEIQGISLNAKINAILTKYIAFYRYVEESEGVIFPHNFLKEITKLTDEDKLIKVLYETGGMETVPAILAHNNIPITLDSLIKNLFEGISLWAGAYSKCRNYTDKQGCRCIVFEHDFGVKYSRVLGQVLANFITNTIGYHVSVKALPITIILRIENK